MDVNGKLDWLTEAFNRKFVILVQFLIHNTVLHHLISKDVGRLWTTESAGKWLKI